MTTGRTADARTTSLLLSVLVVVNGFWYTVSGFTGPLYGAVLYAIVAILCWRQNHFGAAVAAGVVGVVVHVVELVVFGFGWIAGIGKLFFLANLVLPVFVFYFAVRARRRAGIRRSP